jgi:3-phosphoshikimate 1-carboxyvinyltransferase
MRSLQYRITKTDKILKGNIQLPGSKSITNRALIIKALCEDDFTLTNFSQSEDSITLLQLINSTSPVLDAKDGGTTFRFLTAFLAIHEGEVTLTGSERLQQRPIGPLVDALNQLGADIQYLGKKGYPPILIRGKMFSGNKIEIDAEVSSQFISALLLIGPLLRNGLILKLKGDIVSKPYIELTLQVMKHFGISYEWTHSVISVPHQRYVAKDFKVESDWSAASYYYAMAALSEEADLKIYGLNKNSFQGDAVIAKIMEKFGVQTTFIDNGIRLTKTDNVTKFFEYDFKQCPDLAQTMVFLCAAMGIPARLTGLNNLKIKETDRVNAVKTELARIGTPLKEFGLAWNLGINLNLQLLHDLDFETHNDHRMAMSLTPLAIPYRSIIINNPEVVRKSYPVFWDDIQQLGFSIERNL